MTLATLEANLDSLVTAHGDLVKRVMELASAIEGLASIPETLVAAQSAPDAPATKGKVVKTKTKKASKATRKDAEASNSAKYVCDCVAKTTGKLAWGVREEFKAKHVAKGHTVTQVRD